MNNSYLVVVQRLLSTNTTNHRSTTNNFLKQPALLSNNSLNLQPTGGAVLKNPLKNDLYFAARQQIDCCSSRVTTKPTNQQ